MGQQQTPQPTHPRQASSSGGSTQYAPPPPPNSSSSQVGLALMARAPFPAVAPAGTMGQDQGYKVPLTLQLPHSTPTLRTSVAFDLGLHQIPGKVMGAAAALSGPGQGVEGLPIPTGLTTPSLYPGVGMPSLEMHKTQNPAGGGSLEGCLVMNQLRVG